MSLGMRASMTTHAEERSRVSEPRQGLWHRLLGRAVPEGAHVASALRGVHDSAAPGLPFGV